MTSAAAPDLDSTSCDTSPLDTAAPPAIAVPDETSPAAVLRGGAQGLEILVDARAAIDAIVAAITDRLALAPGCLARLDELAGGFELRIIEIAPARRPGFDRRAIAAVPPAPEAAVEASPAPAVEVAPPPAPAAETAPMPAVETAADVRAEV